MLEEPFLSTMVPADAPKMYKPYIHGHKKVSITTVSPGGGELALSVRASASGPTTRPMNAKGKGEWLSVWCRK